MDLASELSSGSVFEEIDVLDFAKDLTDLFNHILRVGVGEVGNHKFGVERSQDVVLLHPWELLLGVGVQCDPRDA